MINAKAARLSMSSHRAQELLKLNTLTWLEDNIEPKVKLRIAEGEDYLDFFIPKKYLQTGYRILRDLHYDVSCYGSTEEYSKMRISW